MSEVLVIGHRNPDTDAICSAIGYAEFKRRTGMASAVAARCGDTNDRIDFVLKTFGVPAPRFVADVSPKVRDVMQAQVQKRPARFDGSRSADPYGRTRHSHPPRPG
jgi:manganese-dependent inorganic pyrophosphatase